MKESLEREIHALREETREGSVESTSASTPRLPGWNRQGGLLRSGQTNIVRFNDWPEKIDPDVESRDKRIDDLD